MLTRTILAWESVDQSDVTSQVTENPTKLGHAVKVTDLLESRKHPEGSRLQDADCVPLKGGRERAACPRSPQHGTSLVYPAPVEFY